MEKCICSGLNDNCFFCGGLGFFEPNDKIKYFLAPPQEIINKKEVQTNSVKKVTPNEIILNQKSYSLNALEKIRSILKEYIKKESIIQNNKNENVEKYKEQIAELERIIFIRVQQNPKIKSKKKKANSNTKTSGKAANKLKNRQVILQNETEKKLSSYQEKQLIKKEKLKLKLVEKILLFEKKANY